mgnify:CR=1 FL=1
MGYLVMNRSDGGVSVRIGVEAADDFAGHVAHWESKPKQVARGWAVASFAYSEADPRPDREFRDSWSDDGGGGIQIPVTKARAVARKKNGRASGRERVEVEVAYRSVKTK